MDRVRAEWKHYLVTVAVVVGVTLVRLLLDRLQLVINSPFLLYTFTIIIAGWRGGFGPGILATVLSALCVNFFFTEPRYTFSMFESTESAVALSVFVLQGAVISWMLETKRLLLHGLSESRNTLEARVGERTRELAMANERLGVSNRELQDFASVASHDLQEPLRKIQAFGDRLQTRFADVLPADASDYLQRMRSAASRMQVLIDDLLNFSRVTTKAQPFRAVDLNQIVDEVVSDLEGRLVQCNGRVEHNPLPTVDADPMQMRQLFQNLLSNALKFHKPDVPPLVTIEAKALEANGGGDAAAMYEFVVVDNGIGFEQKYADRIFTIFQRLHARNSYEGTGIGLAICRKIVERHHGSITVKSEPDQGAAFTVRLPANQSASNRVE